MESQSNHWLRKSLVTRNGVQFVVVAKADHARVAGYVFLPIIKPSLHQEERHMDEFFEAFQS